MCKVGDAPHVRIDGPCFDHVHEADQPVGLEESRKSNEWMRSDVRPQHVVERNQRQHVQDEVATDAARARCYGLSIRCAAAGGSTPLSRMKFRDRT